MSDSCPQSSWVFLWFTQLSLPISAEPRGIAPAKPDTNAATQDALNTAVVEGAVMWADLAIQYKVVCKLEVGDSILKQHQWCVKKHVIPPASTESSQSSHCDIEAKVIVTAPLQQHSDLIFHVGNEV